MITASSRKEASRIARILVDERLAACVSTVPGIESRYRWKGKIETSREILLIVKTQTALFAALERRVRQIHSYDVPEVLELAVARGSKPYLAWIEKSLKKSR